MDQFHHKVSLDLIYNNYIEKGKITILLRYLNVDLARTEGRERNDDIAVILAVEGLDYMAT